MDDYELFPELKVNNVDDCSVDPLNKSVILRSNDYWEEFTPMRYRFQWGIGVVPPVKKLVNRWVDGVYGDVQQISSPQAVPKDMQSTTGKVVRAHLYHILLNLVNHYLRDLEEPLMHSYQDSSFNVKGKDRCTVPVSHDRVTTLLSKLEELRYVTPYGGGVLKCKTDEFEEFAVMLNGVYPTEGLWNTTKASNGEHFLSQSSFTFYTESNPVIIRLIVKNESDGKDYQPVGINELSVPRRTEFKELEKPVVKIRDALVNHNYSYTKLGKGTEQSDSNKFVPGYTCAGLTRIFNSKDLLEGGRYYRGFWQYIKREERKTIKIDGVDTIEEDWSASQWNILYIWKTGMKYDGDVYTLEDHEFFAKDPKIARKILKLISLPLLGAGDPLKSIRAAMQGEVRSWKKDTREVQPLSPEKFPFAFDEDYSDEPIILEGNERYVYLENWVTPLEQKKLDHHDIDTMLADRRSSVHWMEIEHSSEDFEETIYAKADQLLAAFRKKHAEVLDGEAVAPILQRFEADIATDLMLEFLERTDNSPILCVHDSFIVTENHHELLKELMEKYSSEEVVKEYLKAN